jgi:hypothetical protein
MFPAMSKGLQEEGKSKELPEGPKAEACTLKKSKGKIWQLREPPTQTAAWEGIVLGFQYVDCEGPLVGYFCLNWLAIMPGSEL